MIKNTQVDKNQMTIVKLVDFVSIMVANKREDELEIESEINFSHNYIMNFLRTHKEHVETEQVIRIFIMGRRFRLSLQFSNEYKVPFKIEYFTNALESNAYDVAFYLLVKYEDQINLHYQQALDAHVKSYKVDKRFLKSKLHMSKMLLGIFSFNSAKQFLDIITFAIDDPSLEGNLFSHSSNPLSVMCLLYEFLTMLIKKFFSLNNICRMLMGKTMNMALKYIEAIDDDNFLTTVLLEKDYSNRDCLRIA